jgi:hypothetical protein
VSAVNSGKAIGDSGTVLWRKLSENVAKVSRFLGTLCATFQVEGCHMATVQLLLTVERRRIRCEWQQ